MMIFRVCGVLLAACTLSSGQDTVVKMDGGNRITGEVMAMDNAGKITVLSPISKAPLEVKGAAVREIVFGITEDGKEIPDQRVRLTNGDVLPVRVTGLGKETLLAISPDMSDLEIPRDVVDSIRLGMVPRRVIFTGPSDKKGWIFDQSNPKSWEIKGGRLIAEENGVISRDVALPEKFIIRFELTWKNRPNFKFTFADPLNAASQAADRYFLQFAGAGLQLKRESTKNPRFSTVALIDRSPDRFAGNRVDIEIRMDRSTGLIHFYLDGVLEGRYADRISEIPAGSGISFYNQAPRESRQTIQNLEILEWDERGDRHRSEDRGDGKEDSLIGRFGERFSGTLAAVRAAEVDEGKTVYVFKSDFKKEMIELPEEEVSTVFFGNEGKKRRSDEAGLVLKLRGGGEMQVSACEFEAEVVNIVHPLLGPVTLGRSGIASLERRDIPKAIPISR